MKLHFIVFILLCLPAWLPPAAAASRELMEYDITWVGVSVGTMTVQNETDGDGNVFRSIRIWNRPWIAKIYPVDNTVECRIETTSEGPCHTITKKMGEKNFVQDDTLTLWPGAGRAVWSNAVSNAVHSFEVPKGSMDFVSFFFDLRDAARNHPSVAGGNYQLVMDHSAHALEIQIGATETIRTPRGPMEAIPVRAISKSPTLFSRNRPRAVWVAAGQPVVIFADVQTRFGAVRATLEKWDIDGRPVGWTESSGPAE